jgi:GT2 family glycosyltransferase
LIVPFAGSEWHLYSLINELGALSRRQDDELIVADNSGTADTRAPRSGVRVCAAQGIPTPGFARNRAAQLVTGDWLVFIDADTHPDPALLDAYFDPPPAEDTAILAGGIADVAARPTLVARHAVARAHMSQRSTLERAGAPYAQTANCAVRRSAFDAVGGFDERARAGEDADLCFRLARAGWALEERPQAKVLHQSRETLAAWAWQLARHGSGAAWLNRRYQGQFPPPPLRALAARLARNAISAVAKLARGDLEDASFALLDLTGACAFELGRLLPNRPLGRFSSRPRVIAPQPGKDLV